MRRVDVILDQATVMTMAGTDSTGPLSGANQGALGQITNAAVAVADGRVVGLARRDEVLASFDAADLVDLAGRVVTPGLIDAHTHPVWAGTRVDEFEMRVAGAGYVEIAAAGGGIASTVRSTRNATEDELLESTIARIDELTAHGATTVEAKTGYGLRLDEELRHLKILGEVAARRPTRIVPTFLGAHALPPEYADRPSEYVDLVVHEMLPAVAALFPGVFVDVFCDEGAFTTDEAGRILAAAANLSLPLKAHSDEFANIGCTAMAAELGATSVDHLVVTTDYDMVALARSATVGVLLPGTTFGLGSTRFAPARELIAHGIPVALGTDLNPGTCPSSNLALVMALATRYMGMSPAEALVAFTRNAAYASGCGDTAGQLALGRAADITVFDTNDYRDIAYRFGGNPVWAVMIQGEWAVMPPVY